MSKRKTISAALLVMLLWGSLFPLVKLGYGAYNITTTGDILLFAGIRFTICGAVICLYSFIKNKTAFKMNAKSVILVLLSGLFAVILHYSFTYMGLSLTDSSKTAILKQIGALLYVCVSFLFFKDDRFTAKKFIAAMIGFCGIVAINADASGIHFNIGDAFIIAASFCTVFSNVISKKALDKVHPIALTGISQLFGGGILLIVGKSLGGSMTFDVSQSFVFVCIIIASIISYCLWFTVVKDGELSKLFIIKFAEPVFACIFGALILGERIFSIQYFVAFLLIACGIYISNR